MSDKIPQPPEVLAKRLQRIASFFDLVAKDPDNTAWRYINAIGLRSRANTCWQAAARLEQAAELLRTAKAQIDDECGEGQSVAAAQIQDFLRG